MGLAAAPGGDAQPVVSPGAAADVPPPPALADGVELLGEYRGSGYREPPWHLRCGGRTLEISALLHLVCESLDGKRDLDEVAAAVSARSGREVTADDIKFLVDHKLRPLGVIARTTDTDRANPRFAPALGLSMRKAVLSKDAVRRCSAPLQVLFRRPVVWVTLFAFAALDVWLLRGGHLRPGFADLLLDPSVILLVAGLTLVASAFHELGHATACRYGGAEPGTIGVGIYLVWPVFYNDLTDSYRLDRAGRLRTDLGGMYFNVLFILALMAGYATTGYQPLVVAAAVQHLVILQQFLPFVRLDGYYVVSDLVGVPDLFGRVRPVISSLLPGRPVPPAVSSLKPRARAMVTAWVLVTVPLLCGVLLLLIVRLPELVTTAADSLAIGGRSTAMAWREGRLWVAALECLQLALVVIPPVGIMLTLWRALGSRLAGAARRAVVRRPPGSRRRWVAAAVVTSLLAGPVVFVNGASADATFNQHMLRLINRERAANGLNALVVNPILGAIAEDAPYLGCGFPVNGRAADMGTRNYFSHAILNCGNKSVFHMLGATSLVHSGAAENIAWVNGVTDPLVAAESLHSQLMQSTVHRANILKPDFTGVGIGSWRTAPGQTWTGAGFPLLNVYIVAEIFAGLPLGLGGSPTTTTTTAAPSSAPTGRFTPLSPARIADTRTGTGLSGPLAAGGTVELDVAGRGGIPSTGVGAVAMNVTVTQPTGQGFMTLYPGGTARPLAANLNFVPGQTVANLVVVKVGSNGKVALHNSAGTSHAIVDVAGWYSQSATGNAGRFEPVAPARILDTRTGVGGGTRLGPGSSLDLQVAGRGGVPSSGAQAAVLNVTAAGTTASGYLTIHPAGEVRPNASTLNFAAGAIVPNRAMVKLGSGGKVTIFNGSGSADVIVDVGGWFTDSSVPGTAGAFVPLVPNRILDTRTATGNVVGMIGARATVPVQVTGRGGVPSSGVRAVVLNATVTSPASSGYLTIFPSGVAQPVASDVNFLAGETRQNLVVVQLGAGGRADVFSAADTHLIFDVAGWIS